MYRLKGAILMDSIFDWCVDVLYFLASVLGITYQEINVWIFVIIWPILTLVLIGLIVYQQIRIRRLQRALLEK
jgi:hypothetical protein